MTNVAHILVELQREFPAPPIEPQWVNDCAAALIDDGQAASLENIREQYLYSDLSLSTTASDAIPDVVDDKVLFPVPTLVQIVSLIEIASSAFQLQTVSEQRKEVLSGATRIRRMDDEEERPEGYATQGVGVDEDGGDKLPSYPRGMLKMEVSDGNRQIKAIEYRRLPGIKLGETRLGSKLVLHQVRAIKATLMLAPDNTTFLGYEVAALEAEQPTQFVNSILRRMGKPVPGEEAGDERSTIPVATAGTRTAQRITLPPRPASTASNARVASVPAPVASPYFNQSARPSRTARAAAQERITTLYDQTAQLRDMSALDQAAPSSSARKRARPNASRQAAPIQIDHDEDDEFGYDDSFIRHLDAVEAKASTKTNSRKYVDIDDDDDDDWFAEIDVEEVARAHAGPSSGAMSSRAGGARSVPASAEVIEVSD